MICVQTFNNAAVFPKLCHKGSIDPFGKIMRRKERKVLEESGIFTDSLITVRDKL